MEAVWVPKQSNDQVPSAALPEENATRLIEAAAGESDVL